MIKTGVDWNGKVFGIPTKANFDLSAPDVLTRITPEFQRCRDRAFSPAHALVELTGFLLRIEIWSHSGSVSALETRFCPECRVSFRESLGHPMTDCKLGLIFGVMES